MICVSKKSLNLDGIKKLGISVAKTKYFPDRSGKIETEESRSSRINWVRILLIYKEVKIIDFTL